MSGRQCMILPFFFIQIHLLLEEQKNANAEMDPARDGKKRYVLADNLPLYVRVCCVDL